MAKQTRVTPEEIVEMHRLYAKLGTYAAVGFKKIAEKMRRSPDTVSRYVHEYEAAVSAASMVLKTQNL